MISPKLAMDDENSCDSYPKTKKQTPTMETDPDELSQLPDSMLLQIISRLPIDDAVRTGALSTRWKNLWKHVDVVTVHYSAKKPYKDCQINDELDGVRRRKFSEGMNRVLVQFACPNIEKFTFIMNYDDFPIQMLDEWLTWIVFRNVKVLILKFAYSDYCVPEWFCHNSSLEKLFLDGYVKITFPGQVVSWGSLKSLSLSHVYISEEDISKILLGCPVLENLVLKEVSSIARLNIVSPSVKSLQVVNEDVVNRMLSEVNAPWLEYLDISGTFDRVVVRLVDVPSLLKANLTLTYAEYLYGFKVDMLLRRYAPLLESVLHVGELVLGQELIEALSVMKRLGRPCPDFRCKHLTIHLCAFECVFPGMAYLFERIPHIETLLIECKVKGTFQGIFDVVGVMCLNTLKVDFQYLKNVKISQNFAPCFHDQAAWLGTEDFDFDLSVCIMRNAHFLETLVITSPEYEDKYCRACAGNCISEYFAELSHRFFRFFPDRVEDGESVITPKGSSLEIVCSKCVSAS